MPEEVESPRSPEAGQQPLRWSALEGPEDDEPTTAARAGKSCRRLLLVGVPLAVLGLVVVAWAYFPRGRSPGRPGPASLPSATPLDRNLLDPENPLQAEAVELADQLVEDFPKDVRARFIRGLILNKFVSRDEAAKCWRACIEYAPDFGEPYYWLGRELFKKGEHDEAVLMLRKAVQFQASMPDVRIQLADALVNLGRIEEAIPVLEEQVRVAPEVTAGFFYLGQANSLLGRLDVAVDCYRQALELNPECHQAWHGLAIISQRKGETEKAREYFEKFHELQAVFHADHHAEKRRDFGDFDTLQATLATAYTDAGRLYLRRKDTAAAERMWGRAAAVDPQDTQGRGLLLESYGQQGRFREMLPLLEELRQIQPENPVHCRNLGMLCMTLGQSDRAEEAFCRLVEMAPQRAEGYASLSGLYVRTGRKLPEAVELARKAVRLQPTAENYFHLSEACAKNGDRPAALAAIERALELDPGNRTYRQFQTQWADGK